MVFHTYFIRGSHLLGDLIRCKRFLFITTCRLLLSSVHLALCARSWRILLLSSSQAQKQTGACFCFATSNFFNACAWFHSHTSSCRHTVNKTNPGPPAFHHTQLLLTFHECPSASLWIAFLTPTHRNPPAVRELTQDFFTHILSWNFFLSNSKWLLFTSQRKNLLMPAETQHANNNSIWLYSKNTVAHINNSWGTAS